MVGSERPAKAARPMSRICCGTPYNEYPGFRRTRTVPFDVMAECCNQCLMTPNKIVSNARRRQIVQDTRRRDCHFICHKADGRDIACRGHMDATGGGQLARIAHRLNAVRLIDPETLEPVKTTAAA